MRTARLLATFAGAFVLAACGGGTAHIPERGPMPTGGSYNGVWFSPQYGEMDLIQTGDHVTGWYQVNERQGRIEGHVTGNVLHFTWEERREMVPGKPDVTRGRGYFVYHIDHEQRGKSTYEVHRLKGEWGLDDSESGGGPWTATKALKREPKPNPPASSE